MTPGTRAEDTPRPNRSLTLSTHRSSLPKPEDGPLHLPARLQHPIRGRQIFYRNNGSTRTRSPNPISFNKKQCTLILVEIGFCRDLGYDIHFDKKTEKYSPLIAALRNYWGRVEFVAFPIGHADTTLTRTLDHLTAALSTVRPSVERSQTNRSISNPATDHNAKAHDFTLFKSLLELITDLAQSRLLGIIRNRKRLVDALPGGDNSRTHPVPLPAHYQAAHQQGSATHTNRARTTRAPESTAIT